MPRPHSDSDPDGIWPSCDDEQPGASIRPLRHADLAALLTHLDQHQDPDQGADILGSGLLAPVVVVVVRVRASVGRPGASAHAEYRRRRAMQWAAWTHALHWRVVAVVAASVTAWLAAGQVAPDLAAPASITVAAALAWGLRFRVAPDILAWRRGAAGSGARPGCWPPLSGMVGRCCTTWPSRAPRRTSITWSSARVGWW
jgi:hypothetical protein